MVLNLLFISEEDCKNELNSLKIFRVKWWNRNHRELPFLVEPAWLFLLLLFFQCRLLLQRLVFVLKISKNLVDYILRSFYRHNFELTHVDMVVVIFIIVVVVVVAWAGSAGNVLDDLLGPGHHPLLGLLLLHLQLVPLQRLEPSLVSTFCIS